LSEETLKTVVFKIQRYDASKSGKPYFSTYKVPVSKGTTIVDALIYTKENFDPTLSFRVSCRMGACGSCGILVNGIPKLACQTQIINVLKTWVFRRDTLELRPLPNFPVIKDLIVDFDSFFEKHKSVKPHLIRMDEAKQENPLESLQTPRELEEYVQFAYCIKCGVCYSACPTTAFDSRFLGPQALCQAYRYSADSRDQGFKLRAKLVNGRHGIWRCHFAGACSHVCPKGVDPAFSIQLLKKALITGKKP